MDAVTGL